MPKSISTINYIRALQIMFGEWKSISPSDYLEEDTGDCVVIWESITAEDMLIKQQAWQNLSVEAKEIIMAIISSPNEILEMIKTPKRKLITQKSISRYFKRIWMSEFITDFTIKEIIQWTKEL